MYPSKQAPKAQHARSGELTHKPSRALRRARASIVVSVTQWEVRMADRANVGGRMGMVVGSFESARERCGDERSRAVCALCTESEKCGMSLLWMRPDGSRRFAPEGLNGVRACYR